MKEKILLALKSARGQNTSTSDRTLDKLATTLSVLITDETKIPTDIELKGLIEEITGNISFVAAEAVKNVPPATPPATPATPAPTPTPEGIPSWFTAWTAQQDAKNAEFAQKVSGFEQKGTREAMVAQAKQEFYKTYSVNDVEKALCEKALDLHLQVTPAITDAASLQTGWKTMYEDLRSVQGLGGLTPVVANDGGGDKPKTSEFTERLIKLGKIPAPTS